MTDPEPNTEAARILREATKDEPAMPADLEAAWEAWIGQIQQVDARAKELLRAAFEAGAEAARSSRSP